jgi:hypothetical protein
MYLVTIVTLLRKTLAITESVKRGICIVLALALICSDAVDRLMPCVLEVTVRMRVWTALPPASREFVIPSVQCSVGLPVESSLCLFTPESTTLHDTVSGHRCTSRRGILTSRQAKFESLHSTHLHQRLLVSVPPFNLPLPPAPCYTSVTKRRSIVMPTRYANKWSGSDGGGLTGCA